MSLYALCQLYMLVNNGALVDLVTSDLFGCGGSSKSSAALEANGGMKGENREAILRSENLEGGKNTQQRTKLSQPSVVESPHPVGFRYRRALLACLSKKRGGGRGRKCLRLGFCVSAGVSVVRCAANNPAAAEACLRDRGVSNQGAGGTGAQGEENRKRLLSGSGSPVGVVSRGSRGGRAVEGPVTGGRRYLNYDGNDNRRRVGDEASGACNGDGGGGVYEERTGNECFEQVSYAYFVCCLFARVFVNVTTQPDPDILYYAFSATLWIHPTFGGSMVTTAATTSNEMRRSGHVFFAHYVKVY